MDFSTTGSATGPIQARSPLLLTRSRKRSARIAWRPSLVSMALDVLVKLRDNIAAALSNQAAALRAQIAGLTVSRRNAGGRKAPRGKASWRVARSRRNIAINPVTPGPAVGRSRDG